MSRQPAKGVQWWAVVVGWVAAVLVGLLIGGVLGVLYERVAGTPAEGFAAPTLAVSLVSAFLAYLVGGFVAARLARYSGGLHGTMTAVFGFVAGAAVVAVLLFAGAGPFGTAIGTPVDPASITGLLIVGVTLLVATLAGGYVGGRRGQPDRW